jgi:voltage-gated potassium channel Kch
MVGAISEVETALYFSTVTFTTLGYGDVVLDQRWRLVAAFKAVNGIIIFGLTTAAVIAVVQWVSFSDGPGQS